MIKHSFLLIVLLIGVHSTPIKRKQASSCQACHSVDPDKINIHLIPHSHDDAGWLKTVDQYFYGSHPDIQKAGVQYIISSAVEALNDNPDRRFVQVETAFFWKWWEHQNDLVKQSVVDLVNNGQLEILNAAWTMNDEAATHYQSTIDQFTYGLRKINETLGECGAPRIGWQIDPFGHSREQASIYTQIGFDAFFTARIDYNDRDKRISDKNMEVLWKSSDSLDNSEIFFSVFPSFYNAPSGFCFDYGCSDDILVDDEKSPEYNLRDKVDDFYNKVKGYADYYRTSNVLIPMGGDFHYQAAHRNFHNMDKLIAGFKGHENLNVIYSTPSCYLQAVNDEADSKGISFNVKEGDFFPYGTDSHCYWTGYYTSRANAKRFERSTSNILQAAKQLAAFSKVNGVDNDDKLRLMKEALGILQHHDAITGTAKEAVSNDYTRLMHKSVKTAEPAIASMITNLLKKDASSEISLDLQTCLLANTSVCEVTNADRFVVTVYNPLERPVTHYVRLPVSDGGYKVTGPNGEVKSDLLDSISSFSYFDTNFGTPKPKELVFAAEKLEGFEIRWFYVEKTSKLSAQKSEEPKLKFGTDTTGFEIDGDSGLVKSVKINGQNIDMSQRFLYYRGSNGDNNGEDKRASGAYIFRPIESDAIKASDSASVSSTSGNWVDEVRQEVTDWIKQIIRVYKGEDNNYIEFDWLVGPIPATNDDGIGKEVISRFSINDFDNGGVFYTDSNGREMIKRERNKRKDYEYNSDNEPTASNYYPVTSKLLIRDDNRKLEVAVLNDRAEGGSSLHNGEIELMVHRRLLRDDSKGVGEPLDDEEFGQGVVARGQLYLVLGSSDSSINGKSIAAQERDLALKKLMAPLVLVADASSDDHTLDKLKDALNTKYLGLKGSLPDNVHILTLEPWIDDTYLLRLEHILEKNEDSNLSQTVTVDLSGLFNLFDITELRETNLAANQWLENLENKKSFSWTRQDGSVSQKSKTTVEDDGLSVTLTPMQIRTFVIKVVKN